MGDDAEREALRAGFAEVEKLSRQDVSMWRHYGLRWMGVHYWLGVPATVLAALSAGLGGTDTITKGHAALLAGAAAILAALVTGLRASTKWDTAKHYEHGHQVNAEAAWMTLTAEIDYLDVASLRTKLDKLVAQRAALVAGGSAPS